MFKIRFAKIVPTPKWFAQIHHLSFQKKLVHDDARAPVGAGDNDENDDINDNDNYGVVQTGLFGQQAGRQVYKCTGDISGALVYRAGANAGLLLSLPLFLSASYS